MTNHEPYTVVVKITPCSNGHFVGECLDVPGCISEGRTEQEATDKLITAITEMKEMCEEVGLQFKNEPSTKSLAIPA